VPELLVTGLQAMEDRQFKHHHGVELKSIFRALLANLRQGRLVQGGSTITQQLVKNFYLNADRTLIRKINEALMSVLLELHYDKAEILETYLNEIYLGQHGARAIHGFGRASEFYFGVPLDFLESHQVALLIGMVKGASFYNPRRNPERALQRRNLVLGIFHETGLIGKAELTAANARPLDVLKTPGTRRSRYPGFIDLVKRQLRSSYREADLQSSGLRIFTTLEPATQQATEAAMQAGLSEMTNRGLPADLQAAFVVANINSGEVQALVGDRDPSRAGFNRALDARRQIGSVIKPLVYLQALQHETDFNLLTRIPDGPVNLRLETGDYWQPKNFDGVSHGEIALLDALIFSYNQATVHLGMQLGVGSVIQALKEAGVERPIDPLPSVLLGAVELSPLEVTQVYQSLAAGGFRAPLRAVTSVLDADGQPLNRYPLRLNPVRRRDAVAVMNYALTQVAERGTARSITRLLPSGLSVAGKTGTTNERRDSWFVGYTQERLAVAWVGLDDNRPAGVTGSNGAGLIWSQLFNRIPARSFEPLAVDGASWYWVNRKTGELSAEGCPGVERMMFLDEGLPTKVSDCLQKQAKDKTWWRKIID
jgi:penicillin-binding protein 1B